MAVLVLGAASAAAAPALGAERRGSGLELGLRTGYAFAAGHLGAPPNGTDYDLADYVRGQVPLWFDIGYRLNSEFYVGGYFQYGFGSVNDDQQTICRNANVDCSASNVRVGLMGRYHFAPVWLTSPWVGLGVGYEWGTVSLHQSILGNSSTDSSWSGFEIANLQVGTDFPLSSRFVLAPFVSLSIGQYQSNSTTTTTGATTTTADEDLAKKSLHEWILIGVRLAFSP